MFRQLARGRQRQLCVALDCAVDCDLHVPPVVEYARRVVVVAVAEAPPWWRVRVTVSFSI